MIGTMLQEIHATINMRTQTIANHFISSHFGFHRWNLKGQVVSSISYKDL
jgi:hypothetical protein